MDVLMIEGTAPGLLNAMITHAGQARRITLELARHPAGGWHARQPEGAWNLRCHSVPAAILMEAAELFAPDETAPQTAAPDFTRREPPCLPQTDLPFRAAS